MYSLFLLFIHYNDGVIPDEPQVQMYIQHYSSYLMKHVTCRLLLLTQRKLYPSILDKRNSGSNLDLTCQP